MTDSFWDIFLARFFPTRILSVTTRSGRHFRFNITDYRVHPNAGRAEISELATRIVDEKYRYCDWDRCHPKVNSELEIFEAVMAELSGLVELMKRHWEECEAQGRRGPGIVGSAVVLTHTTNYSRVNRRRTAPRMRKVLGVFDNTGTLLHTFDLRCREEADECVGKLNQSSRKAHYVGEVKVPMVEADDK